jgi:hypothetical protein
VTPGWGFVGFGLWDSASLSHCIDVSISARGNVADHAGVSSKTREAMVAIGQDGDVALVVHIDTSDALAMSGGAADSARLVLACAVSPVCASESRSSAPANKKLRQ